MSHYTAVKTKYTNKEMLVKALQNMGFLPEIHDKGTNLINRWGTTDIAHIVIRREQLGGRCGADLGFKKNDEGYSLTMDDFEMRYSSYDNFKQDLGTEYACLLAQKQGFRIVERGRVDGKMQIKLAPPKTVQVRR